VFSPRPNVARRPFDDKVKTSIPTNTGLRVEVGFPGASNKGRMDGGAPGVLRKTIAQFPWAGP
jgi:hypothetical protein